MQGPQQTDSADFDEPTQQVSQWARLRRAVDLNLDDPADSRFGDYLLLEKIGTGGMGVVYRARQLSLDREVALKLLSFDPFSAEALISRFRTEARHAGRLQHPNIVAVFEIGGHENFYFFSMSLVRGPTLRQWLRQHEDRSPQQVAALMRTIAEAVQYAHQVGILHLDLKPGNVLIDERGEPQVSDFGLARRVGDAAGGEDSIIAGTPAFMAPEQTLGDPAALSMATDVWGLGGILYSLLTGRPPTDEESSGEGRSFVVRPPRVHSASVPADLDAICMRCLQRDPALRYPSARAMADDLQRYLDGRSVSVREQSLVERVRGWARREPRSALLATGLLAVLLIGLASTTLQWRQSEASRELAQRTLWDARRASALAAAERGDPLAGLPGLVANVAEAESSGSASDAEVDRRRVRLLLDSSPRQIDGWTFEDEGRSLAFARDGSMLLAGLRGGDLIAMDATSGQQRWRITPPIPPTPWGPSFVGRILPSDDGKFAVLFPSGSSGVARPDTSSMQRVDLDSGELTQPPADFGKIVAVSYSFDGKRALLRGPQGNWQLWETDPWRPLGDRFTRAGTRNCLVASAGSALACAGDGFSYVEVIDGTSGAVRERIVFADAAELASWNTDSQGRWLALGSANGALLLYDLERGVTHPIADAAEDALGDLRFSGSVLSVSSNGGSVRLLDVERRIWLTRALRTGAERIGAALYDPDSHWLMANDGRVVLWRLSDEAGRLVQPANASVLRHDGAIAGFHAVALDTSEGLVASQGSEGELKLFRLPEALGRLPTLGTLVGTPADVQANQFARVDGSELAFNAESAMKASSISLPHKPYLLQGTDDGRYWALAAGHSLLLVDRDVSSADQTISEFALPSSAQYLMLSSARKVALVGWIGERGPLHIVWRSVDLRTHRWLAESSVSEGLPGGMRLSPSGQLLALWQGREVQIRQLDTGAQLARWELDANGLHISDAVFHGTNERELAIATSGRSLILPASLEHWRWREVAEPTRLAHITTPSGQIRVFDLGDSWLTHGPRPAIFRDGERHELLDLGAEWSEATALSPDRRWAAFGESDALWIVDLTRRQPLETRRRLNLSPTDALASLTFSVNGEHLITRSHFGVRHGIAIGADTRPLRALQLEADDMASDRDQARVSALEASALSAARRARDVGPPLTASDQPLQSDVRPPAATPGQIDLRPYANVPYRRWFQGSRRGLGITDSASWPQGLLRLRGIDFDVGPALQLAPKGVSLGAATFSEASGPINLPNAMGGDIALLIANQQKPTAEGLRLSWLGAGGEVIAEQAIDVPTTYDSGIHADARRGQPNEDVALVLRSAESRLRGGGSAQLLIYLVRVARPQTDQLITAVELHAPGSTPLVLGMSVLSADGK